MNKKLLLQILTSLLLTALGLFLVFQGYRYLDRIIAEKIIFNSDIKISNPNVSRDLTISGVWECLPSDFSHETSDDCVMGLKNSDGNYYFLTDYDKHATDTVKAGKITVTGRPGTTVITTDQKKVNIFLVTGI